MDYFIRIEDPKSLRVALMSTARDALLMQMTLEELQAIRKEKLAMLNCAKEDFRQITNMCKKLSETIADDKVKREILNSLKLKEEIQPIKLREFKPYTKQETKEETNTSL